MEAQGSLTYLHEAATDPWTIGRSGFDSRRGWEFFSTTPFPECLSSPLSLLSNVYRGLFPWG